MRLNIKRQKHSYLELDDFVDFQQQQLAVEPDTQLAVFRQQTAVRTRRACHCQLLTVGLVSLATDQDDAGKQPLLKPLALGQYVAVKDEPAPRPDLVMHQHDDDCLLVLDIHRVEQHHDDDERHQHEVDDLHVVDDHHVHEDDHLEAAADADVHPLDDFELGWDLLGMVDDGVDHQHVVDFFGGHAVHAHCHCVVVLRVVAEYGAAQEDSAFDDPLPPGSAGSYGAALIRQGFEVLS